MKRLGLVALLAVACSTGAYAQSPYSTVYVFGDSYSDRGRGPGIILGQYPDWPAANGSFGFLAPAGVTNPPPVKPYFNDRFSNGPTWAERLPKLIRVRPNPQQNYAVGGATLTTFPVTPAVTLDKNGKVVQPDNNPGTNFETVPLQLAFSPDIQLPGIQKEIDCFLAECDVPGFKAGGRFGPSAVVALFGGGNDYFAFLDREVLTLINPPANQLKPPTLADVPNQVTKVTNAVISSVHRLAAAGAKTLLVPNIPDIGALPAYTQCVPTTTAPCDPKKIQDLQNLKKVGTALSVQHNAALNAKLGKLANNLGVNIFVVDFATALKTVQSNPARFGFTNITDPCVPQKEAPAPASLVPGTPCTNPDEHFFWDNVHPTSAAHQILAEYAADTLLAPQTIGAQANFALTNGDSFLRRMQETILGTDVSGRGQPRPSGSKDLTLTPDQGYVFINLRRETGDGSPTTSAVGFDYGVTQASAGVVVRPWHNVALGLIGGIDDGTADLDHSTQPGGSIDLTSYHVGAMGGYDNGALFAGAGVSFSHDDYDLYRQTFVPQLQSTADTSGNPFGAFGSAGYRFNLGAITAGPLLALRYTNVSIDKYSENGAPGLDMIVQSQQAEQLIGSAGIAAAAEFAMGSMTVSPYLALALEGDLLSDDRIIRTALVTVPDVGRRLQIGTDDDVYGRLNGGISLAVAPGLRGTLSGETTISRDAGNEQAIYGSISGYF